MNPRKLMSQLLASILVGAMAASAVAQVTSGPERLRSLIGEPFCERSEPASYSSLPFGPKGNQNEFSEPELKPSVLVRKKNLFEKFDIKLEAHEEPIIQDEEHSTPSSQLQWSHKTAECERPPVAPTLILPAPNDAIVNVAPQEFPLTGKLELSSGELATRNEPTLDQPDIVGPINDEAIRNNVVNDDVMHDSVVNDNAISDSAISDEPFRDLPTDELATNKLPGGSPGESVGDSLANEAAIVIIRPPMVQPFKRNQYTFVVENVGTIDAFDVKIGISVPESGKIIAVLPENSVASDRTAIVSCDKLAAGDTLQIHLTASSPEGVPISFATTLSSSAAQKFQVQHFSQPLPVQKVAQCDPVTDPIRPRVENAPPADRHTPVENENPEQNAPVVLKNPFFDSNSTQPSLTRQSSAPMAIPPSATVPPAHGNQIASTPVAYRTFAEGQESSSPIPSVAPQYVVAAVISGPKVLAQNETGEYEIAVINQTGQTAKDVVVQLTVPVGLEMVAMQQKGEYDVQARTCFWRIALVENGRAVPLRYRICPTGIANYTQTATLQVGNRMMGHTRFETLTVSRPSMR
jgi:hypothetical protein